MEAAARELQETGSAADHRAASSEGALHDRGSPPRAGACGRGRLVGQQPADLLQFLPRDEYALCHVESVGPCWSGM